MGSLCKSGPSTTNSSSTTNSTYTPAGLSQLNDIWGRVSSAASTPFTAYGQPLVAGVNDTQQGGINNITGATSYLDTARDYATSGAAPIDAGQIERYTNPFQSSVIDATQRNFNESNAQQDNQLKGNSIARGAWGGDRADIGRAELMRQQKLAQDPVIAGLNSQGFNLALSAAQADRAAQAQGGYQFGALGNSAIGQGQAQIGAGSVQQGTDQAKLAAQYQEFMRAQAYPYQQAQFLASAGLPAVTGMGGTTAGQTQGTSQTYAAQPSILGQVAGLGIAGLGAAGGLPGVSSFFGGGGGYGAGTSYSQPMNGSGMYSGNPAIAGFGPTYRSGGRVAGYSGGGRIGRGARRPAFADGGFIDQVHAIRQALRGGGAVQGPGGYAMGGWVDETDNTPFEVAADRTRRSVMSPSRRNGFADGGDVSFGDRFGAADDAIADGTFDPVGINYYTPGSIQAPSLVPNMPMPRPRPADAPIMLPPQMTAMGAGASPMSMPPSAMPYDGAPPSGGLRAPPAAMAPLTDDESGSTSPFAMPQARPSGGGGGGPFNLSDDARMGMIAAGLGMMASRNPSGLGAIGEGGLQGVKTYTEAKNSRQKNEIEARRLIQNAEQFSQTLGVHKDQAAETKRYHDILDQNRKDAIDERKTRTGYIRNPDGSMSPIKGGPADPEQLASVAKAKQTGGLLPEDTADFLAERVLAGDTKALIGLGRGAQGAENISKIQTLAARKAAERNLNPSDILAKTAEQSGLTASQRTFGTQIAKMAVNSTEAQGAIELGREASAAVPRTNWVPINKLIQAGQVITSDPKLIQFAAANLAIVNTYARAISPTGTPTVHDKEHAEKLLSTATGPEAYNALLNQLNKEIEIAHAAPLKAKKELETIRTAPKTTDPNVFAPTQAIPSGAIDKLRSDPNLATQFDAKYGVGAAKRALGQ